MKAETFLIQEFEKGNCTDITEAPEPNYELPFFQSIIRLMEEYAKQNQSIIFIGGYEKGIKEGEKLLLTEMTELYIKKK